jgi:virginiamycin B lyase
MGFCGLLESGIYGRLDPKIGKVEVFDAPRGVGPYGISTTPDGKVYFASLAGSYIANIDLVTGNATVLEPPTNDQGARRVWPDSEANVRQLLGKQSDVWGAESGTDKLIVIRTVN